MELCNIMTDAELYEQILSLPPDFKKEVLEFIGSLKLRANLKPKERQFGCAKGLIEMKPDFDEPLEDFIEYMNSRGSSQGYLHVAGLAKLH
jgi:hypothetical protein